MGEKSVMVEKSDGGGVYIKGGQRGLYVTGNPEQTRACHGVTHNHGG